MAVQSQSIPIIRLCDNRPHLRGFYELGETTQMQRVTSNTSQCYTRHGLVAFLFPDTASLGPDFDPACMKLQYKLNDAYTGPIYDYRVPACDDVKPSPISRRSCLLHGEQARAGTVEQDTYPSRVSRDGDLDGTTDEAHRHGLPQKWR